MRVHPKRKIKNERNHRYQLHIRSEATGLKFNNTYQLFLLNFVVISSSKVKDIVLWVKIEIHEF